MVAICTKTQHSRIAIEGLLSLTAPALRRADLDMDDANMLSLVETLASDPLPLARMVAIAMLREIGSHRKWNVARRKLLKKLRADDDPGVQEYAYHFFTVQES
jgi:hypothetical protein